jgi:predicted RNase H-like HicB family nuclease
MKYPVIHEKSPTAWGAYAPDLPGPGLARTRLEEGQERIGEATEFHLAGMRQHGDPIPVPSATAECIKV